MQGEGSRAAVPVVSVGGYLGTGKTTLVNHVLAHAQGRRFVVFVNDFGAINIDASLIESVEEDRIAFTSGCVCCTLNDDFVASVVDLVRSGEAPDGILIEASGVADPRALDASLRALEAAGHVRSDAMIYVIDADHFGALDYIATETVIDHAVANDLVLINKSDIAGPARVQEIRETLEVSAPATRVMPTRYCAVPLDILFSLGPPDHRPAHGPRHGHDQFFRWEACRDGPVDREAFREFTRTLQGRFFRVKGLVRFRDAPQDVFGLNCVGGRSVLQRLPGAGATGARFQIVGINPTPVQGVTEIDTALETLFA